MQNNTQENNGIHQPIIRTSYFRFYEELNDFLPEQFYKKVYPFSFGGTPSVKNLIETIGVPHTEVDLILVDGISVGFGHILIGGEHVSVYPVFESIDISPIIRLRAKTLRKIRFVVDVNLGKLAKKLRLLGFDTFYKNDLQDDEVIKISLSEKRIILTRDIGILKNGNVTHGFWIRSDDPKIQLNEVIERLQLKNLFNPFTRCSQCNGQLKRVKKELLKDRIPEDTLRYYKIFWECRGCRQIYWEGSHFDKIIDWIDTMNDGNREHSIN
ncbi:MAG TPA: Mut7-C RNAse domain-containing protein [Draconibacterium sp.]|nr:Mut7-C RNAse domain-containing protein [Draconibacterium sp.]